MDWLYSIFEIKIIGIKIMTFTTLTYFHNLFIRDVSLPYMSEYHSWYLDT